MWPDYRGAVIAQPEQHRRGMHARQRGAFGPPAEIALRAPSDVQIVSAVFPQCLRRRRRVHRQGEQRGPRRTSSLSPAISIRSGLHGDAVAKAHGGQILRRQPPRQFLVPRRWKAMARSTPPRGEQRAGQSLGHTRISRGAAHGGGGPAVEGHIGAARIQIALRDVPDGSCVSALIFAPPVCGQGISPLL